VPTFRGDREQIWRQSGEPDAARRRVTGNTHLPFGDLNNVAVADLLSKYLHANGLDVRTR
jgi:hypothetical protein